MKKRPSKSVSTSANRRSPRRQASAAIVGLLSALGVVSSANAVTSTWTGTTNGTWDTSTAANWGGTAFTSGNDALFTGTPTNNVTTATGLTIGAITLDNTFTGSVTMSGANTVSGATTISGGTLNLTNAGGLGTSAITLNSSGTVNVALTANGNVANVFTGSGTLTVSGSTGTPTFSNASGLNGFTGTLNVNTTGAQKVAVTTAAEKIGSGATVNITSGSTLYIANTTASFDGVTFNVVGRGNNENLGALRIESNSVIGATSSFVLGGNTSIGANSGTGTINAAITQSTTSALTKLGGGTLVLSGANTYTGATTVSAGTLSITGNSTGLTGGFVVNSNGAASTLTLNGNTGSIASSPTIQLNGGTFNYQHATASTTFDASGYTFSGSDRNYQSTYGSSGNAVLNLANATRTAGTANNYITSGGTNGTTNKITFTSAPSTGVLVDKGDYFGGTSYLAYDSTGYARAYSYSTDANGATSTGGATLGASVTGKNVDLTTAAVTAQTTDSINTLRLGTANGVAITTGNTLSVDGILKSGGSTATISGGSIQAVSSGGEMVIRSNATNDVLTITSVIADNGTSSLTTSGLGRIDLNAANTYAGGTKIGGGVVTFNNASSFGTGTITSAGGVIRGNGPTITNNLVVNGATTLDAAGNWTLSGNISGSGDILRGTNAGASIYLTGDNSGYTGTFTVQNSTSSVVRFGNGAATGVNAGSASANWVFNNTNTGRQTLSWNGTGTINFGSMTGSGQIQIEAVAAAAGSKTISVGALGNANDIFSGIIANGGTGGATLGFTKTGTGTMTLSGANTYTGATTISGGKLNVTGSLANSATAVSGGTTTTLGGSGSLAGAVTVTNGSRLAPGSVTSSSNFGSIGTLTLSNASGLTLTDAHLDFDLVTSATGTSDKISLGANALSFSTLNFSFSGTTLDTTTAYTLISTTNTTSPGTLANITTDFSAVTGGSYTASYSFVNGTGLQVSFTAVPEPHQFALAIVGLLGVLVFIRRRNQQV
jgi:autotransporter-associated beta strand protein